MKNESLSLVAEQYLNSRIKGLKKPFVLMILDGWGYAPAWGGNAIALAKTPNFDYMWKIYPHTVLSASGEGVGLSSKAPGNSEAGHLNIGAGRIVYQNITVIDKKIEQGQLKISPSLCEGIKQVKKYRSNVHIIGLLSETGTHSHFKHLLPILENLKENGIKQTYIHFFSDGRDSDPMAGLEYLSKAEYLINKVGLGEISSIMGRFYAMDRDNHWGRTARAYNAIVKCEAEKAQSARSVFSQSYTKRITDEFIEPRIIVNENQSCHPVADNDLIISFNFRSDRIKQLISSFIEKKLPMFPDRKLINNLKVLSFTIYRTDEDNAEHIFTSEKVINPIAKVISDNNLKQLHCAETEKFAHVTYFINGGETKPFKYEKNILIPSPRVRTYDLEPKMHAHKVTKTLLNYISRNYCDFYIVNYANPDMVGHTGNLEATMMAVSFVDICLGKVVRSVLAKNGTVILCADHGNAEQMVNTHTGEPDTEHTTNPVPFIILNNDLKKKIILESNGSLSNIAPTIIELMGLDIPAEMSQSSSLIIKN